MEAIKRQIYVLRDTLKDIIDYNIGTDMVPIEYHVMDFTVPATAAAVVYVLKPDGELDKILADVMDNVVSFKPTKGFFLEGLNAIQIRIVDNNKALVSFTETVRVGKSMKFDDATEAQQETLIQQVLTKTGEIEGKIQIEIKERKEAITEEARIRKETDEKKANSKDLKQHAYRETVKTLTATEEGYALDAIMGKTIGDRLSAIENRVQNHFNRTGATAYTGEYKGNWNLTTEYQDIGNTRSFSDDYFSASSGNSKITVKEGGVYFITASITVKASNYDNMWMKILKNGAEAHSMITVANGYTTIQCCVLLTMSIGDWISAQIAKSSEDIQTICEGGGYLQIVKLT